MDHLISYLVAFVVLYAVPTILCAPLLMYFSGGGLRFLQSLRIAALGFAIMLPAIKLTVEPVIAEQISLIAILLCICGAGFLITQLAAREGVKKTGRLGVGAKSVLSAFAPVSCPLARCTWRACLTAFCHEVGDRQADHRAMAKPPPPRFSRAARTLRPLPRVGSPSSEGTPSLDGRRQSAAPRYRDGGI